MRKNSSGVFELPSDVELSDLPSGTGEFLDVWLLLLEKLVNPKLILESPHVLPSKAIVPGFKPFDPIQYLMHIHKVSETKYFVIFAVYCHCITVFLVLNLRYILMRIH